MSEKLLAKFEREDNARLRAAAEELASSPNLRFFVHDLLEAAGFFRTTFNGNALQSAFAEGQRSVALAVVQRLGEASPDFFPQLLKEQADEQRTREQQLDQSGRADRD